MGIKPKCDKCGNELSNFGALLFSPPDEKNITKKYHICEKCYENMKKALKCQKKI